MMKVVIIKKFYGQSSMILRFPKRLNYNEEALWTKFYDSKTPEETELWMNQLKKLVKSEKNILKNSVLNTSVFVENR
jgi:hypothetical protein